MAALESPVLTPNTRQKRNTSLVSVFDINKLLLWYPCHVWQTLLWICVIILKLCLTTSL
jgi:hypothetical protein